jgi:hypothetical protein
MTEEKTAVGQGVAVGEAEGKRNEATEWRSGALVGSNPTVGGFRQTDGGENPTPGASTLLIYRCHVPENDACESG